MKDTRIDATMNDFKKKYGPWALIAGATEGIGRAFSLELAKRGLNIAAVARRPALLKSLSDDIQSRYPVEVRTIQADLSDHRAVMKIINDTDDINTGILVYNAAKSCIGEFIDVPVEDHVAEVATNCTGPVLLTHHFGRAMIEMKRGGIILMSSMTAFQGTPLTSVYGATKAFNLILSEGLSRELSIHGIDVLSCCAGPTLTPAYINSKKNRNKKPGTTEMPPQAVVTETLSALGNRQVLIPGRLNRFYHFLMSRIFTRKQAVALMTKNMYDLYS